MMCQDGTMVFPSSTAMESPRGGMYHVHDVAEFGSPAHPVKDSEIFPALVLSHDDSFIRVLTCKGLVKYMGVMSLVSR